MQLVEILALRKYDTLQAKRARAMPRLAGTPDELGSLGWYRGYGYDPINSQLRNEPVHHEEPETPDEMLRTYGFSSRSPAEAIGHIDALMTKAPKRKRAIQVFRGEREPRRVAMLAALQPGESWVEDAYLSTSLGPSYAFYSFVAGRHNELMMIVVPPSVRGLYISDHDNADAHTELEFLIDRGTRYTLRERRSIPNKNRGHPIKTVSLSVWDS